jgi:hypothetical protein
MGIYMSTEYKPTLRFNAVEARRIKCAADKVGLKSAEWMRELILDNAPQLTIAHPLQVRVSGFEEPLGWNLIHYAEALAHAEATQFGQVGAIAEYMESYTTTVEDEVWIDSGKVPGVPAGDVTSIPAQAIDLCRAILRAHIRELVEKEGASTR